MTRNSQNSRPAETDPYVIHIIHIVFMCDPRQDRLCKIFLPITKERTSCLEKLDMDMKYILPTRSQSQKIWEEITSISWRTVFVISSFSAALFSDKQTKSRYLILNHLAPISCAALQHPTLILVYFRSFAEQNAAPAG